MRLSVIIPCRNAEPYLAQTIGSVLAQSRPPDEIIVVDDGSTDGSLAIARSFGDRLRVLSGPNAGAAEARNRGAARASGDALMFLDADDVLGPTALEQLESALSAAPGAVALCPWHRLEYEDGRWVKRPPSCTPKGPGQDYLAAWLTGWYHPPCSVLWSRSAYERTGGWDAAVKVNNDGDIMMRALADDVPIVRTVGGEAYYRRIPPESGSVSGARLTEAGLSSRIGVMERIARMLEERGALRRYREALGTAFEMIAADCGDVYPELSRRCRTAVRRFAGPPWIRKMRKVRPALGRRLNGMHRSLRRRIGRGVVDAVDRDLLPAEEVRFGLDGFAAGSGPAVSVIIPSYNRAGLLPRTLDSVLAQTFTDFEILVIDDASTDSTPEVMAGYRDEQRIRYLRQPENRGVGAARNYGLREARGAFIAFLDSDDEWFPDKLALQVARFRELGEDVGLIYSGVESVLDDGARSIETPAYAGNIYREMLLKNVIHGGGSNAVIRREVVDRVGFFDERMPAIEDYDYWLRIAGRFRVDYVEKPLIRYYDHEAAKSDGSGSLERRSRDVDGNLTAREWFYERYSREMKRLGVAHLFLIDSARRHLASTDPNTREARRLLLRALRQEPRHPDTWFRLFCTVVPGPVERSLHSIRKRARRLLPLRTEQDMRDPPGERRIIPNGNDRVGARKEMS